MNNFADLNDDEFQAACAVKYWNKHTVAEVAHIFDLRKAESPAQRIERIHLLLDSLANRGYIERDGECYRIAA